MTKKITSVLLALALIIAAIPALAATASMTLNDMNQITGGASGSSQSPVLSVTLNNLNQVTGTSTSQSPSLSMTLENLNQVTGTSSSPTLSPTLSITLNNLNWFATIGEYGVPLAGLFTIEDKLTEEAQNAFNAIAAYVNNGQAAIGYFDMDLESLILSGALSSKYLGFDFSSLILSEYVSLGINNYQGNCFDVSATFGFASEYQEGQTVVVMFGYLDKNGDIVWNALNTVAVNGQVQVDFPSELLLMAGSEAILGILS